MNGAQRDAERQEDDLAERTAAIATLIRERNIARARIAELEIYIERIGKEARHALETGDPADQVHVFFLAAIEAVKLSRTKRRGLDPLCSPVVESVYRDVLRELRRWAGRA